MCGLEASIDGYGSDSACRSVSEAADLSGTDKCMIRRKTGDQATVMLTSFSIEHNLAYDQASAWIARNIHTLVCHPSQ